jgi:hypothetical protein
MITSGKRLIVLECRSELIHRGGRDARALSELPPTRCRGEDLLHDIVGLRRGEAEEGRNVQRAGDRVTRVPT